MIEFIICEDNEAFLSMYKYMIEKVMMNYDIEVKYHLFINNISLFLS